MRKTGSRQSRRWIRTRRARDHMQARAKLIQRAPRGSPQHLTLTRWPGGLLFHDLGSPSASEPTATAPSRDSRPKGPRAAPVLRFLLTQSEYSGVFRERQRRRSGAVESRTGNLVSTRIDTPCLHVHETFCALRSRDGRPSSHEDRIRISVRGRKPHGTLEIYTGMRPVCAGKPVSARL